MKKLILILIIILVLAAIAALTYLWFFKYEPTPVANTNINLEKITEDCNQAHKWGPNYTSISKCGDYYYVRRNGVDQADIWLDNKGDYLMDCGGFAGYDSYCTKKFIESGISNSCQVITECNPSFLNENLNTNLNINNANNNLNISNNINTNKTISANCQTPLREDYDVYKNEELNICFSYPNSLEDIEVKPSINVDTNTSIEEWQNIIIPVGNFWLSFTRISDYFGRYERAWSTTSYSKQLDASLDIKEIETILKEDFPDIFEVKKVESENTTFIEFFELGAYGNDGSLLYVAIIPHEDWGNIVAIYNIYDMKYVWDVMTLDDIPQTVIDTVEEDIESITSGEETDILNNINTLRNIAGSISPIYTSN